MRTHEYGGRRNSYRTNKTKEIKNEKIFAELSKTKIFMYFLPFQQLLNHLWYRCHPAVYWSYSDWRMTAVAFATLNDIGTGSSRLNVYNQ